MRRKTSKTAYTKKYLDEIKMRVFLGKLSPDEIEIARKTGNLRWDLWKKAGHVATLTFDLHRKGYLLAPVFNAEGDISNHEYKKNTRFLVASYEDLRAKTG